LRAQEAVELREALRASRKEQIANDRKTAEKQRRIQLQLDAALSRTKSQQEQEESK
jgi:hypothetical protein